MPICTAALIQIMIDKALRSLPVHRSQVAIRAASQSGSAIDDWTKEIGVIAGVHGREVPCITTRLKVFVNRDNGESKLSQVKKQKSDFERHCMQ
jgi:hypothetical protein